MSRVIFPPKVAAARQDYTFDFTSRLAAGETISSAVCSADVYSGVDTAPSALISGAAVIASPQVTQLVIGGVLGVTYDLSCQAVTSLGQTLLLAGFLAIVPPLT